MKIENICELLVCNISLSSIELYTLCKVEYCSKQIIDMATAACGSLNRNKMRRDGSLAYMMPALYCYMDRCLNGYGLMAMDEKGLFRRCAL